MPIFYPHNCPATDCRLELAEDLHALRRDLPVILTTGDANNLDANALAIAGVAGAFQKPLNSEQLLAKIHGLLTV